MGRATPWQRLSGLPLTIEAHDLEGLSLETPSGWVRRTTALALHGLGHSGRGEDVNYEAPEQERFQVRGAGLELAGRYDLAAFSRHLDEIELFDASPRYSASRDYRRWAVESAALDLALRQHGVSLSEALALDPRPLRFVSSMGLGESRSAAPIRGLLRRFPWMRFKLDTTPAWSSELIEELRTLGTVDVVDFKGAYRDTPVDQAADPALYRRVAEGLPAVWLEDPHRVPECEEVLAPHRHRVTWDAPIHSVADLEALAAGSRMVNIKPSRFGRLRDLFAAYGWCAGRGVGMYGGGQFELGVGRGQIQYLAALFHADSPNDVAPAGYNEAVPSSDLASSPARLVPSGAGFRARVESV